MLIPDRNHEQWIRHDSCVWNGPPILRQVVRLRYHYQDCKKLFVNILGIKEAGLSHVVQEFSSVSRENGQPSVHRFEKLCFTLARFVSQSHGLTTVQLARIQYAPVFPILQSRDDSQEDSGIFWRSIRDGGWYIPDRITLESVFRGRIGMLEMSVKSVKTLQHLFTALGCKTMFLSECVREVVEPRGNSIRDLPIERDLETRLEHIYQ